MICIPKPLNLMISVAVLVLFIPGVAAFSMGSATVSPSGYLYPGNTVNVTYTVYAAAGTAFSIYDDLQFTTELEDPKWSYAIAVNGVKNSRPVTGDRTVTINGFELGYRNQDEVIVYVTLQGQIPASAVSGSNRTLVKIQEIDSRGYAITSSAVTIDHLIGEPTPTPTPAYGTISVSSSPAGANVYIDNVYKGLSPATFTGVPNGYHVILVRMDGYSEWTKSLTVTGDTRSLSATLEPQYTKPVATTLPGQTQNPVKTGTIPAASGSGTGYGSLSITTSPAGAIVYVDGTMMGVTPTTIPMLAEGPHSVTLVMDGYQDLRTNITINAGTTSEYITGLSMIKKSPGFVSGVAAAAIGALVLYRKRRTG